MELGELKRSLEMEYEGQESLEKATGFLKARSVQYIHVRYLFLIKYIYEEFFFVYFLFACLFFTVEQYK